MRSFDMGACYAFTIVFCGCYPYALVIHLHLSDANKLRYGLLDLYPIEKIKPCLRQIVAHGLNFRARYIMQILEQNSI